MPITGVSVYEEAKTSYLNFGGFTETAALPIINSVIEQLRQRLIENDSPLVKEVSGVITVNANTASIPAGGGAGQYPLDLDTPFLLEERTPGLTNTDYYTVEEKSILPLVAPTTTLNYWTWREAEIKLIGATAAREVRISYVKLFTKLTKITEEILVPASQGYLASALAERAARIIQHNNSLADSIRDNYVGPSFETFLNNIARKNQTMPFRHRVWSRGR